MGYNLDQEKFNIIAKAIRDYQSKKNGIIKYLRENNQVIDLENKISISDFHYRGELKDREIGIKSIPFSHNFIKIRRIALIKMSLKIDLGLINRCEKKGWHGLILHDLNIQSDIKRFFDQIEQFILRGTDTKTDFDIIDIEKDRGFNCFFQGHNIGDPIAITEFGNLHEIVNNLVHDIRCKYYTPPFCILSDSETLKWAEYKYFHVEDNIESYKDRVLMLNNCDDWLDLYGNADNSKGNDHSLVCFALNYFQDKAVKIIEKNPINIIHVHGGIVLYWCGALEVTENAIKMVKVNKLEKFG